VIIDKKINFHYVHKTTKHFGSFRSHNMKFHNENSFQNRDNKSKDNNIEKNRSVHVIIEIAKRKLNSWLFICTNRVILFRAKDMEK